MFMVLLSPVEVCLLGCFFSMSIENRGSQSLEPRRGDICKTFPLAGRFHSVKIILKPIIVVRIRIYRMIKGFVELLNL